jgi:hypothetical protein
MQPSARSLDQIIQELNGTYQPQINSIEQRRAALPGQLQAEEAGLQAKQGKAYEDILLGARRRGVAAGGIPLGEQAKYSATEYMPALARLRTSGQEQSRSLDDAINQIYEKRNSFGHQLKQNEDQLFEGRRQFDVNMAHQREQEQNRLREAARQSAASFAVPNFTPPSTPQKPEAPLVSANKRQNGGYNFTDQAGKPISAAKFAQVSGQPIGSVLYTMGQNGDKYAQQLYNQLKGDTMFGKGNAQYDARIKQAYAPIFWGS